MIKDEILGRIISVLLKKLDTDELLLTSKELNDANGTVEIKSSKKGITITVTENKDSFFEQFIKKYSSK